MTNSCNKYFIHISIKLLITVVLLPLLRCQPIDNKVHQSAGLSNLDHTITPSLSAAVDKMINKLNYYIKNDVPPCNLEFLVCVLKELKVNNNSNINKLDSKLDNKCNKNTCIHIAAIFNDIDILELLIQNGADVNSINDSKHTPLHAAIEFGKPRAALWLIQTGLISPDNLNKKVFFSVNFFKLSALKKAKDLSINVIDPSEKQAWRNVVIALKVAGAT